MTSTGTLALPLLQPEITRMQKKDSYKSKMRNTRMTIAISAGYADVTS